MHEMGTPPATRTVHTATVGVTTPGQGLPRGVARHGPSAPRVRRGEPPSPPSDNI